MKKRSSSNLTTPAHVRGAIASEAERRSENRKVRIGTAAAIGLFATAAIFTGLRGTGDDSRLAHTGNPSTTLDAQAGMSNDLAELAPGTTEHEQKGNMHTILSNEPDKNGDVLHETPYTVAGDLIDEEGQPIDPHSEAFGEAVDFLAQQIMEGENGFLPSQAVELPFGYQDVRDLPEQDQPAE